MASGTELRQGRASDGRSRRGDAWVLGAAVDFYTDVLGFELDLHPAPGFAMLHLGDLRLLLNAPGAGGGGAGDPEPGGWCRFQLEVDDLDAWDDRLRAAGTPRRGDVVDGNGGRQLLVEDPSGNPVELFEAPAR